MIRHYTVYDRQSLQSMRLDQIAAALNHRNITTGRGAYYRNTYGELFAVIIHVRRFDAVVSVWDITESTSLAQRNFSGEPSVIEVLDFIDERTNAWSNGFVYCAADDVKMRRFSDEIGGRYFAGVYSKAAWEREWKARAAKETYD